MGFYNNFLLREQERLFRLTNKPLDTDSMTVVSNLYRSSIILKNKMEKEILSEYGLSWSGFSILYNLWVWDRMEMRELAKTMRITVPSVSSITSTLVKKDLCKRNVDPTDRRLVLISLTEKGLQLIETVYPEFNKKESEFSSILTEGEKTALVKILEKLIDSQE